MVYLNCTNPTCAEIARSFRPVPEFNPLYIDKMARKYMRTKINEGCATDSKSDNTFH